MSANGNRLRRFMRNTGAKALLGYRESVDWIESSAFEILLLGELQHRSLTRRGLAATQKSIHESLKGSKLSQRLGFRMEIA